MASSRVVINLEIVDVIALIASVVVSLGTTTVVSPEVDVSSVIRVVSEDNVVITLDKVVDKVNNFCVVVYPIVLIFDMEAVVVGDIGVVVSKSEG